jgi:integrase
MPRPKSAQPAYQFHISGQAVVELDYKSFYLGKHGSPESYARYYALLAEYNANGRKAPGDPRKPAEQLIDDTIKVSHVTADFVARVLPTYNEVRRGYFQRICTLLDADFGCDEVATFGPRKLEVLRDKFVANGNCRREVNEKVRGVIAIIEHGVSRELVQPDRIVALRSLQPLKPGQCRDNDAREAVPIEIVEKTLPELLPVLQVMVKLQLMTAARPGEIMSMTPSQIDRSGEVWFLRLDKHKTSHKGKTRSIPLLPDAVAMLQPYLFGSPAKPCFVNSNDQPWNKDQYRRAIVRACVRLKIQQWSPYQLRRTAGQKVRDELGAEFAQALYGHAKLSTTEIYTKVAEAKAIEAAKHAPRITG